MCYTVFVSSIEILMFTHVCTIYLITYLQQVVEDISFGAEGHLSEVSVF